MIRAALMREVSDALASYGSDVALARRQQAAYAEALGVEVIWIEAGEGLADCCFVEDAAVVEGGRALITRMGFPERRAESPAVARTLKALGFAVETMEPPATLDGGDVLRAGGRVFCGLSRRTNEAGLRALERFLGRACVPIPVESGLHLKTSVTEIDDGVLAVNPDRADPSLFEGFEILEAEEPNALRVNERLLVAGMPVAGAIDLDISEFRKADGGLTCLSIPISKKPAS